VLEADSLALPTSVGTRYGREAASDRLAHAASFSKAPAAGAQRVYELGLDLSDSGSTITLENLLSGIVMAALPLFYSDSITLAYR
jgi:hypothetical protein